MATPGAAAPGGPRAALQDPVPSPPATPRWSQPAGNPQGPGELLLTTTVPQPCTALKPKFLPPQAQPMSPAAPPSSGLEDYSFLLLVHDIIKCMNKDSQEVHQLLNGLRTKFVETHNLIKSMQGLLPVYFGSLAFCYILVFTCMLLLQWRKQILQKRRAKVWMKQLKAESYFQHALAHRADEEAQPKTNAAICNPGNIPEPQRMHLPGENIAESNDNSTPPLPNSAPYKPIFQEVACVCALSHLPPLLAHSASYPCSAIPTESSPFSSPLKPTVLKNDPYSMGSRISA